MAAAALVALAAGWRETGVAVAAAIAVAYVLSTHVPRSPRSSKLDASDVDSTGDPPASSPLLQRVYLSLSAALVVVALARLCADALVGP